MSWDSGTFEIDDEWDSMVKMNTLTDAQNFFAENDLLWQRSCQVMEIQFSWWKQLFPALWGSDSDRREPEILPFSFEETLIRPHESRNSSMITSSMNKTANYSLEEELLALARGRTSNNSSASQCPEMLHPFQPLLNGCSTRTDSVDQSESAQFSSIPLPVTWFLRQTWRNGSSSTLPICKVNWLLLPFHCCLLSWFFMNFSICFLSGQTTVKLHFSLLQCLFVSAGIVDCSGISVTVWRVMMKWYTLLWRNNCDDFGANEFHHNYDGHANTLMFIWDTKREVFGLHRRELEVLNSQREKRTI